MNTESFLAALRAHSTLPLVFSRGSETIASGYHLTEVKDVTYRTMDCGAMSHHWTETQFELWVPSSAAEAAARQHMAADKFLRIVQRVEQELPLESGAEARIFAQLGDAPPSLYGVSTVTPVAGRLLVELAADRTRCKARERSGKSEAGAEASGCCSTSRPAGAAVACCG